MVSQVSAHVGSALSFLGHSGADALMSGTGSRGPTDTGRGGDWGKRERAEEE